MGINLSFLPFFDICNEHNALHDPVYVLGTQDIHEHEDIIFEFAHNHMYSNLARDKDVRALFHDRYGIREYHDCDVNKRADIWLDLNKALNPALTGKAKTVLDSGTIEHVFDIRQAFSNIHQLAGEGATIVHLSPLTWFDHGFFNFNPRLFKAIMSVNHYQLIAEAFHFNRDVMNDDKIRNPALYVTFHGEQSTNLAHEIQKILTSEIIPANVLYMIAYRKMKSDSFEFPYDIQE